MTNLDELLKERINITPEMEKKRKIYTKKQLNIYRKI